MGNSVSAVDIYGRGFHVEFHLQRAGITTSAILPSRHWLQQQMFGWAADERDEPHNETLVIAFSVIFAAVLIVPTINRAEVIVMLYIITCQLSQ